MIRKRTSTLLLLALSIPSAADVSLFVATPGGAGDVWTLKENQTLPPTIHPELTGIRLLSIDVVGRTQLDHLREDANHLRADMPEGTRVVLPSGRCLYRYLRAAPDGSFSFGLFSVEPDGRARPLGELPGTGSTGQGDPLLGRLAMDPDADAFLLATTLEAGGDLYEFDFNLGRWAWRSASLPPLRLQPDALCLAESFGAALTDTGLVRFARTSFAQAASVGFDLGPPAYMGSEIVCSADGSTLAFRAGDGPQASYIYAATAGGLAIRLSHTPQEIVDVGYLPSSATGPRLALSPDGKIAAWIVQQSRSRELFVVNTGVQAPVDVQVTRDANFEDTLNDSGVISFLSAEQLVIVAGEADGRALPGIEEAELFCVDFGGAVSDPSVANLSRTLNSLTPPFDYGRLTTEDGIFALSNGSILAHDPGGPGVEGSIISVDFTGPTTLFQQAHQMEWAENVGSHTFVKVQLTGPGEDSNLLDVDPAGQVSADTAPELTLSRHAVRTQNGFLAAILQDNHGGEYLGRVGVMGQGGMLLVPFPATYGPTVGFTSSGAVAASHTTPSGSYFMVWPQLGPPRLIWPQPLPGHVLPAN